MKGISCTAFRSAIFAFIPAYAAAVAAFLVTETAPLLFFKRKSFTTGTNAAFVVFKTGTVCAAFIAVFTTAFRG